MAKLSLTAQPTFVIDVGIPVAGASPAPVKFTFKHKSRDELTAWLEASKDAGDAQAIADITTAWDLDDKLTLENIEQLCQQYGGAASTIFTAYLQELRGARAKN